MQTFPDSADHGETYGGDDECSGRTSSQGRIQSLDESGRQLDRDPQLGGCHDGNGELSTASPLPNEDEDSHVSELIDELDLQRRQDLV